MKVKPKIIDDSKITFNPLGDEFSSIKLVGATDLIDGTKYNLDQIALLAARTSTDRQNKTGDDPEADWHLMADTLAQGRHVSPFEHMMFNFIVKLPLFVRTEWLRHWSQFFNEESMRYTGASVGKVYRPVVWRLQSKKNKQGSDGILVAPDKVELANKLMEDTYAMCKNTYDTLIKMGNDDDPESAKIARELARLFVPQGNYTTLMVSAVPRDLWHFCNLRISPAAQWEIQQYAIAVDKVMYYMIPDTWAALNKYKDIPVSEEQAEALIGLIEDKGMEVPLSPTLQAVQQKLLATRYRKQVTGHW